MRVAPHVIHKLQHLQSQAGLLKILHMTEKLDDFVELIEIVQVRLPRGTSKRIDKVLRGGELRSAFIRMAVMTELRRREPKPVLTEA
jgi:hypothetical protein